MATPATRTIAASTERDESARRLGIAYQVLLNHDGELLPTLEIRKQVIRRIRRWNAEIVLATRDDYHPDHRYTGALIQDAAYMVVVPAICPIHQRFTGTPFSLP